MSWATNHHHHSQPFLSHHHYPTTCVSSISLYLFLAFYWTTSPAFPVTTTLRPQNIPLLSVLDISSQLQYQAIYNISVISP